jgi:DNA-directed RNA polymerase specialized sigma24 family protein
VSVERSLRAARRVTDPLDRAAAIHNTVMPAAAALWDAVVQDRNEAILDASEAGRSMREIAEGLGVSQSAVQMVLRSERERRHGVTDPCSTCGRQVYAKGLCEPHYRQARTAG